MSPDLLDDGVPGSVGSGSMLQSSGGVRILPSSNISWSSAVMGKISSCWFAGATFKPVAISMSRYHRAPLTEANPDLVVPMKVAMCLSLATIPFIQPINLHGLHTPRNRIAYPTEIEIYYSGELYIPSCCSLGSHQGTRF